MATLNRGTGSADMPAAPAEPHHGQRERNGERLAEDRERTRQHGTGIRRRITTANVARTGRADAAAPAAGRRQRLGAALGTGLALNGSGTEKAQRRQRERMRHRQRTGGKNGRTVPIQCQLSANQCQKKRLF